MIFYNIHSRFMLISSHFCALSRVFLFISRNFTTSSKFTLFASISPEERLKSLGFDIDTIPVSQPKGNYASTVRSGTILYLAGHLPYNPKTGEAIVGKVGDKYTADEAKTFAKWAALRMLKTAHKELGSLSRVKRVVKINGFINCTDDFIDHPKVMNGASDFLAQVFDSEIGLHVRTAIGCISLPFNVPVEMDMTLEIIS